MDKLLVSPSPHIQSSQSVNKLMYGVVLAMIPVFIVSVIFYGLAAIYLTIVSVVSCIFFEYLIQKFILKTEIRIKDGSALVTGLLLAFNLPSGLPPFIIVIGALVAIGIGKMTFGGLGNNPFNPALVGRVFLLISFPTRMTKFAIPKGMNSPIIIPHGQLNIDGVTGATPLALIKEGINNGETVTSILNNNDITYNKLILGDIGGSIGEIATIAILIGFAYLLIRKIISWHIPVSILGTVFLYTGILWLFSVEGSSSIFQILNIKLPVITFQDNEQIIHNFHMAGPIFHLLTGGIMLGAIFMATDYVTSPMIPKAMIFYGIGIGFITCSIRIFGAYPEGISFAILIMNGFTPLLNRYMKPKRFGTIKKN